MVQEPRARRAADDAAAAAAAPRGALPDVAAVPRMGRAASVVGRVGKELGARYGGDLAGDLDGGLPRRAGAAAVRVALSLGRRDGGVHHDTVGVAGKEKSGVEGQSLQTARMTKGWTHRRADAQG